MGSRTYQAIPGLAEFQQVVKPAQIDPTAHQRLRLGMSKQEVIDSLALTVS